MNRDRIIHLIKKCRIAKYAVFTLLILYVFVGYEEPLIEWYNVHVVSLLAKVTSNIWLSIFCLLTISVVAEDLLKKYKNRYVYDTKLIFASTVIVSILLYYRIEGDYDYLSWFWYVTYVDVIWLLGSAYVIGAIVNSCRFEFHGNNEKDDDETILSDEPILSTSDDIFDLDVEAKKIAGEIEKLPKDKTWSLAITAPWGFGKTSFMNMIIEEIDKEAIDVIYFNPRDSRSCQSIQEDFFASLTSSLSNYDSSFSHVMKDYMASLQLIDNRHTVEKLINPYKIWDKQELKDSLSQAFKKLKKKFVIDCQKRKYLKC